MKTATLSNRFHYHELDKQDAQAIKNDILLYNQMFHKAYKLLSLKFQGIPWEFDSFQKEIDKINKKLKKLIEKTKQGKQTEKDYLKEVQELRPKRKA